MFRLLDYYALLEAFALNEFQVLLVSCLRQLLQIQAILRISIPFGFDHGLEHHLLECCERTCHALCDLLLCFFQNVRLVENFARMCKLLLVLIPLHIMHEAVHQLIHCDGHIG